MKEFIVAIDRLPWIAKLLLALPFLNIVYGIYRLIKGLDRNDLVLIIAGLVWIFAGWAILWIIDLITVILYKKITIFA
ncbi:MAG: hypothetical protein EA374_02400 [Acholeplasmatales bacterium]|nr:MAG: hypothetical protein EA374_02400 [Acholeplasmatales bacterium]